ncbi:MAG TPA: hypothetical protein VN920_09985 [Pyrinomonadaceae bacterium]|nr:hypothetical protein [Pyrinomonadaceae bacterium]
MISIIFCRVVFCCILSRFARSRGVEDFKGQVATVNGVVLRRDAATFKFNSGEIYFLTPVEQRTIGAVFIGDGEMTLVPPTEVEKHSLAIFRDKPETD